MAYIGKQITINGVIYTPLNADPSNPTEGQVFYADGTSRAEGLWVYKNGNWSSVGAGVSDKSVYAQFDAEDKSSTGFTNISTTATSPINQENSYEITAFPAEFSAVTLNERNKNKENSVELHYTMASGTAKFLVKDQSAATLAEVELSASSIAQKSVLTFFVPATTTNVTVEFQDVSSATSLKVDDVIFSDDPFKYKNALTRQSFYSNTVVGSTGTLNPVSNFGTPVERGSGLFSESGGTFTVLQDCYIGGTIYGLNSDASASVGILVDRGSGFIGESGQAMSISTASSGNANHCSLSKRKFLAGDQIRFFLFRINSSIVIDLSAEKESEFIVTPLTANINSFTEEGNGAQVVGANDATPFGSANNQGWDGDQYTVQKENSIISIKFGTRFTSTTGRGYSLFKNGVSYKEITQTNSSTNHTGEYISSKGEFEKGDTISVRLFTGSGTLINLASQHYININETGDAQLLGAIPVERIAILQEQSTSGASSSSNTVQIRDINTVKQSGGFVTLSGSQFTLPPGAYDVEYFGFAYRSNYTSIFLYDVTNSQFVDTDKPSEFASSAGAESRKIQSSDYVEISSPTTYEIRHWTNNGDAAGLGNNGFATATNPATTNVHAGVKIRKIK